MHNIEMLQIRQKHLGKFSITLQLIVTLEIFSFILGNL